MSGNSWVTLATNDSYSLGALVLAHSLKRTGTVHNLTVMVTPGVSGSMRSQLATAFNIVQEVNILDSKDEKNLALLTRPELGVTFTKLHCWRLTQFAKCVFLDADVLVLRNCDELFEREELSAAPDVGWPDCFNSGVFVYRPSIETYNAIINHALSQGSFDGGDQGLLNQFFSDWATKDISRRLPFIYNMCSSATYSYLPAFKQFGQDIKIVHFIGSSKPWLQYLDSETRQVRPTLGSEHLQGLLQLWWDIFCNDVHSKLSTDMAGLAGALSQLTLGVARSPEQSALEEHLRKQAWEHGNIDYMGKDSFDNIWRKICQTLSEPLPDPLPEQCDLPSQVSSFTVHTQEVTSDDVPLPSLAKSQIVPSENSETKATEPGITTPGSQTMEKLANVLHDESSSKLVETCVEGDGNLYNTQLTDNTIIDQKVPLSSAVLQSTSVDLTCIGGTSSLQVIDEPNASVNLLDIVLSSTTKSEDNVSKCLDHDDSLSKNLSEGEVMEKEVPANCAPIDPSQELAKDSQTNVPVALLDQKTVDNIFEQSLPSELDSNTLPQDLTKLEEFQADVPVTHPEQICPSDLVVDSIAHPKYSQETKDFVQCETDVQNIQDNVHLFESIHTRQDGENGKSIVDSKIPEVVRVIEPTPPTSPLVSLDPETGVSDDANVLTIDSTIPVTPPSDPLSSKISLETSEISRVATASPVTEGSTASSVIESSTATPVTEAVASGSTCTIDPKTPIPPKRRHRPSQRGQRGKK